MSFLNYNNLLFNKMLQLPHTMQVPKMHPVLHEVMVNICPLETCVVPMDPTHHKTLSQVS